MNLKKIMILALLLSPMINHSQDRITGLNFATRSEVIAKNGMACTSQPLANQVALDILKKWDSNIDAIGGFLIIENKKPSCKRS